jgi:hypothetical protein
MELVSPYTLLNFYRDEKYSTQNMDISEIREVTNITIK